MVEVFKTSIQRIYQAEEIIAQLNMHFPDYEINIDLEDCDNILRVKAANIKNEQIMSLLHLHGVECEVLPG